MNKRLTNTQEILFRDLWLDGVTMQEIADATGLAPASVSGHARRRGLPRHLLAPPQSPDGRPDSELRERWLELMPELRANVRREVGEIMQL